MSKPTPDPNREAAEAFAANEDAAGPNYCEARDGSLSISSFTINVDMLAHAIAARAAAAVAEERTELIAGLRRQSLRYEESGDRAGMQRANALWLLAAAMETNSEWRGKLDPNAKEQT